jgi:outer membrane protein assembly factor BamB
MLGGTPARNMVNPREKLPELPGTGPNWEKEGEVRAWEAAFVLWKAELGSRAYGGPAVAGGRVFVGTNNDRARNPRDVRVRADGVERLDKGVLMCFDAKTGRFLWQAVHDKLADRMITDWPKEGLCSTPAVVGDRAYYVSNQCRVVCVDVNGLADGNQGFRGEPYQDPDDADVVWEYDMIRELKVFPHSMSNCSPLVVGDRLFACTSNGVDENHVNLPSPDAPSLVCLDRHTGKLLWSDNSPGKNVMHAQWSSPSYAAEPVPQVLHAQGDGWLRAFDPATGKLLWKFDCNRKDATHEVGGGGDKSDFIAMPVVYKGRAYIGTGQDPEYSAGPAHLWCLDLKKAVELGAKRKDRDVSPELLVPDGKDADGNEAFVVRANPASALAWVYGGPELRPFAPRDYKFCRTMSTVAIADDVLYAGALDGHLHCLDALTGTQYWQYDTRATIWGSPMLVDGRVLLATDSGDLFVFRHAVLPATIDHLPPGPLNRAAARQFRKFAREQIEKRYLLAKIEMPAPVRTTPVVAGGVLYVATENALYAFGQK